MFIPKELSQDTLPYSFRYYDAIIPIVHETVSDIKKDNFACKQILAYRLHHGIDFKTKTMERLGIIETKKNKK